MSRGIIELYRARADSAAQSRRRWSRSTRTGRCRVRNHRGPEVQGRQINILGNTVYSDNKLREQMANKQARLQTLLSSNTSYDQTGWPMTSRSCVNSI